MNEKEFWESFDPGGYGRLYCKMVGIILIIAAIVLIIVSYFHL